MGDKKIRPLHTAVVMTALFLLLVPLGASGQEGEGDLIEGSGRADARILRAGPSAGNLSLAPSGGLTLADYRGTAARAESRALDYAALEDSVHSLEEDLGEPILTEELYPGVRAESSEQPQREDHPPFVQEAEATDAPEAHAVAVLEGFEIPDLLRMSGGRARSFAGVFDRDGRRVREAGGTVVIGRVELAGGDVILRDLWWQVTQATDRNDDEEPQVDGRFVIGSADVGATHHEGPLAGEDLEPVIQAANQVLGPSGLQLALPEVKTSGDAGLVTPLAVRIADSELGKTLIAPVLEGAQPAREQIVDSFLEECPDCASLILVADVALGVFSGANQMDVELGGTSGFTEGEVFANPFAAGFEELGDVPGRTVELGQDGAAAGTTEVPRRSGSASAGGRAASERLPSSPSALWAVALVAGLFALGSGLARYRQLRTARLHAAISTE